MPINCKATNTCDHFRSVHPADRRSYCFTFDFLLNLPTESHSRTLERENKTPLNQRQIRARICLGRSERGRKNSGRGRETPRGMRSDERRCTLPSPCRRALVVKTPQRSSWSWCEFSLRLSPRTAVPLLSHLDERGAHGDGGGRGGTSPRLSFFLSLLCPASQRHVLLSLLFCLFVCFPPTQPHKFRPERSRHGMRATRLFPTISPPSLPSFDPAVSPFTMTVSRSAASRWFDSKTARCDPLQSHHQPQPHQCDQSEVCSGPPPPPLVSLCPSVSESPLLPFPPPLLSQTDGEPGYVFTLDRPSTHTARSCSDDSLIASHQRHTHPFIKWRRVHGSLRAGWSAHDGGRRLRLPAREGREKRI